jgi:hypothetical protein
MQSVIVASLPLCKLTFDDIPCDDDDAIQTSIDFMGERRIRPSTNIKRISLSDDGNKVIVEINGFEQYKDYVFHRFQDGAMMLQLVDISPSVNYHKLINLLEFYVEISPQVEHKILEIAYDSVRMWQRTIITNFGGVPRINF